MAYYMAVDAGGTKLDAILFDDQLRLISRAKSGGVNTHSSTEADCLHNVRVCLDELLGGILTPKIARVYITFIGPIELFKHELEQRAQVMAYTYLHEGVASLLAGTMHPDGIIAVAGTGSNVYSILEGKIGQSIGGWGPIISDRGSGAWIGRKAMELVEGAMEGWLPKTPLLSKVQRAMNAYDKNAMIQTIYHSEAPYRAMALLLPAIAQAAREGDESALKLFLRAGDEMAKQTVCLIEQTGIPRGDRRIVCCGGAWKAHEALFARYRERMLSAYPDAVVQKPLFDSVLAGVVHFANSSGAAQDPFELKELLSERFEDYLIKW